jgi:starvation-inducible DNA-binding protein
MATQTKVKTNLVDVGLEAGSQEAVVQLLNRRLSDIFTIYTKTRNYHWNVTGIHFRELHELFEEQYTQLAEAMDETAERVRQLGGFAYGTLEEFKLSTALKEQPGVIPSAPEMIRNLTDDHELIIRQLRTDVDDTAEKYRDQGTSDFLTALMQQHEKMAWMLRAHLEGSDQHT